MSTDANSNELGSSDDNSLSLDRQALLKQISYFKNTRNGSVDRAYFAGAQKMRGSLQCAAAVSMLIGAGHALRAVNPADWDTHNPVNWDQLKAGSEAQYQAQAQIIKENAEAVLGTYETVAEAFNPIGKGKDAWRTDNLPVAGDIYTTDFCKGGTGGHAEVITRVVPLQGGNVQIFTQDNGTLGSPTAEKSHTIRFWNGHWRIAVQEDPKFNPYGEARGIINYDALVGNAQAQQITRTVQPPLRNQQSQGQNTDTVVPQRSAATPRATTGKISDDRISQLQTILEAAGLATDKGGAYDGVVDGHKGRITKAALREAGKLLGWGHVDVTDVDGLIKKLEDPATKLQLAADVYQAKQAGEITPSGQLPHHLHHHHGKTH